MILIYLGSVAGIWGAGVRTTAVRLAFGLLYDFHEFQASYVLSRPPDPRSLPLGCDLGQERNPAA